MDSKTKNRKTRPHLEALVARAFGGMSIAEGEEAVLELKEGWFNVAYQLRLADGREVVLKIAPPQDAEILQYEQNIMASEVAAMRLVRQNPAIPVPEIYFYDNAHDVCDVDYFFMTRLPGDNFAHVKESLPPETRTAIEQRMGEIVRQINTFPGGYFGYPGVPDLRAATWKEAFLRIVEALLEDGARKKVTYDYSYAELRAAIHKHAPALDEITAPCLVHWDAWDSNFFVQDGQVTGILDFERALWAEPLMEAQFRSFSGEGAITESMRGYGKTSFSFPEEQRCRLYSLHLALVMNTECYYRNYDTNFAFDLSRLLMDATMTWLKIN